MYYAADGNSLDVRSRSAVEGLNGGDNQEDDGEYGLDKPSREPSFNVPWG